MSFTAQYLGFDWIGDTLRPDATLAAHAPGGVHRDYAPPGTPTPYVIVSAPSGTNRLTANAVRVWTEVIFQAKAVGPESQWDDIAAAAAQIDTLLDTKNVTRAGAIILFSYQESPLSVPEIVEGEQWSNEGGLYRVAIQEV